VADADISRIRELLRRYSEGDRVAIADLIARSFFTYDPAADEPTATEVYAAFAADLKAAAPDLTIDIPDLVSGEGGLLRGTAIITGTQTGALWGVPASGESHTFRVPVTMRGADGRFAVNVDLEVPGAVAILREMGLVNPPDEMHLPSPHPVELPDFFIKVLFTGQVADKPCPHLADVRVTRPTTDTCGRLPTGRDLAALRMCLTCGHVGCCDTATNKHARTHWEQTGHRSCARSAWMRAGSGATGITRRSRSARWSASRRGSRGRLMAYMVYQRYTTAIRDAYGTDGTRARYGSRCGCPATRAWLESLDIDATLRASLVEPIAIVEDAFDGSCVPLAVGTYGVGAR
jgi:hypothetical protein